MPSRPEEHSGVSTLWYASIIDFIRGYCSERFGEDWHVSPEYSLLLHAGATVLPKQIVVYSPKGKNGLLSLPEGCSILDYQSAQLATGKQIELIDGIRALPLPVALARVPDAFFSSYGRDAQIALHQLSDASEINHLLLEGGHSSIAGRLAGAFRAVGRRKIADEILATMRVAGYVVNEKNPFTVEPPKLEFSRRQSPYVLRMRLMWRGGPGCLNRCDRFSKWISPSLVMPPL
ncbi:MAG: cell filamentation protein Fic, partial [Desulfuromonadales bacterium]|nr:cell filamentation protein Fic [Desulfuromonadales bacterium]